MDEAEIDAHYGGAHAWRAPPPPPQPETAAAGGGGSGASFRCSTSGGVHAGVYFFNTFFCACAVADRPEEHFYRFKDGFDDKGDPAVLHRR